VSAIGLVPDGIPEHSATLTVMISNGSCPYVVAVR
jgi:hypothetical protein